MSEAQADIDALLAEAQGLAVHALAEVGDAQPTTAEAVPISTAATSASGGQRSRVPVLSDRIARILRIQVPVIVKLAERKMPLSSIVGLATGAILEFDKGSDSPLDLMINNKSIGIGQAVKVGENFGLRVTHIGSVQNRIEALGAR